MKSNVVYFNANLDRIATSPQDFIDRFTIYADALRRESNDQESVIDLIIGGFPEIIHRDSLRVFSVSRNWILQLYFLHKFLKKENKPITLVSGDNDISLILCVIIKLLLPKVRIQISIHGSFDSIFRSKGAKATIKRLLLSLGLSQAKNIRIVSESDLRKFQSLLSENYSKVFVSPIPIHIPTDHIDLSRKSKVGIVGRLHKERGLPEMAGIFQEMDHLSISAEVLVIGGGTEEDWLQSRLFSLKNISAQFVGNVKQEELALFWGEIRVLLSCAPLESYGMALREALANGVFVIAKKNQVTESLEKKFPVLMSTYSDKKEAVLLISEALSKVPSPEVVESVRAYLRVQQSESLSQLAKSWIY
jgi:glycosyltransferase involved in cell wall biosynthesis